ncbi:MAG: type IV toxin-antitoxin system AbiEi family antitoxin domain-containing protein [Actinomycetota bacterium]|nr:type IV toxin-antitoxin system AbiEi family antitoxin domain-containing protein [Actinomycetota bacterium]
MSHRSVLREIAETQHGYVTTRDAGALGVPAVELRKLTSRGALKNVARGLYRFPDIRRDATDAFAEAVLRVGPDAHLDCESVLALLDLALVEPSRIIVATPHRVRLADPAFVNVIQRRLPVEEITEYDGIRATRVWRALIEAQATVMTVRLQDALAEARRRDLVTPLEARRVRRALQRAPGRDTA